MLVHLAKRAAVFCRAGREKNCEAFAISQQCSTHETRHTRLGRRIVSRRIDRQSSRRDHHIEIRPQGKPRLRWDLVQLAMYCVCLSVVPNKTILIFARVFANPNRGHKKERTPGGANIAKKCKKSLRSPRFLALSAFSIRNQLQTDTRSGARCIETVSELTPTLCHHKIYTDYFSG